MEKATNLPLQEAFDLILEEFRERIIPQVFAKSSDEPTEWKEVPANARCDMFVNYVKHLEDKKLISDIQAGALELKYLDEIFGAFTKRARKW